MTKKFLLIRIEYKYLLFYKKPDIILTIEKQNKVLTGSAGQSGSGRLRE